VPAGRPRAERYAPEPDPRAIILDPFETPAYVVADAHAHERAVFCHLPADVWEPGWPDAHRFPPLALGGPVNAGRDRMATVDAGSRWLDLSRWDLVEEILDDRLSLCAAKGFDGIVYTWLDAGTGDALGAGTDGAGAERARRDDVTRRLVAAANRHRLLAVVIADAGGSAHGPLRARTPLAPRT
jgi:hypothetical protein